MSRQSELVELGLAWAASQPPRKRTGRPCLLCAEPKVAHGLCARHYAQLRRRGDPEPPRLRTGYAARPAFERLWDNVLITPRCWIYSPESQGVRGGYRQVLDQGRQRLAHRLMWETAVGPIPPNMEIAHTCDNPPCIRLSHLRCATHSDNELQKRNKGALSQYPAP